MVYPFCSIDPASAKFWILYHCVKQRFIMILASVSPVVNDFRSVEHDFSKVNFFISLPWGEGLGVGLFDLLRSGQAAPLAVTFFADYQIFKVKLPGTRPSRFQAIMQD
jgi:hypothetical protein